jgi:hypothetical protein
MCCSTTDDHKVIPEMFSPIDPDVANNLPIELLGYVCFATNV